MRSNGFIRFKNDDGSNGKYALICSSGTSKISSVFESKEAYKSDFATSFALSFESFSVELEKGFDVRGSSGSGAADLSTLRGSRRAAGTPESVRELVAGVVVFVVLLDHVSFVGTPPYSGKAP